MNSDVLDTIEAALRNCPGVLPHRQEALAEVRRLREADDDLREALAAYAHEAWSGWMRYLFEKGGTFEKIGEYEDGKDAYAWTMTMYSVERWSRQMSTPYADLPEEEKESDRQEADRMIAIMRLREAGPQWEPVADGSHQWSDQEAVKVDGAKLEVAVRPLETFYDSFGNPHQRLLGWESVEVELPDGVKLMRSTQAGGQDGE